MEQIQPVSTSESFSFRLDHSGFPYIPYEQIAHIPAKSFITPDRPGYPVFSHVFFHTIEEGDIAIMRQEGILVPPQYAILADTFRLIESHKQIFICCTPVDHSHERDGMGVPINNIFYDPLIGIDHKRATTEVPHGVKYHSYRRWARPDSDELIWRYIPPHHIIASVDTGQRYFFEHRTILQDSLSAYVSGEITEHTVRDVFVKALCHIPVQLYDASFSFDEFITHFAASATEGVLVHDVLQHIVTSHYEPHFVERFSNIQPSYPWTQAYKERWVNVFLHQGFS